MSGISIIFFDYLLGSLTPAYWITKIKTGKDIRKIGSGNPGAANTFKNTGKLWGLFVFAFDVFKGMLAVYLVDLAKLSAPFTVLGALAVMVGHNWSCFLHFSGGKGMACALGALIYVFPKEIGIALAISIILGSLFRLSPWIRCRFSLFVVSASFLVITLMLISWQKAHPIIITTLPLWLGLVGLTKEFFLRKEKKSVPKNCNG